MSNDGNIQTVAHISEKLDWAIRSLARIQQSGHDRLLIQDNFWSFLTAFKQSWFYYFHLVADLNPHLTSKQRNKLGIEIIEKWKEKKLNPEEQTCWNVLQALRDFDTHSQPLLPTVEEREGILANELGQLLMADDNTVLSLGTMTFYFIRYEGQEYQVINLANNGISALRKLLQFIPEIK
jgi:hypothetical protein